MRQTKATQSRPASTFGDKLCRAPGVIAACTTLQLVWRGGPMWLSFDWPTAAMITAAFAALWLTFSRRAVARGMMRPPGRRVRRVLRHHEPAPDRAMGRLAASRDLLGVGRGDFLRWSHRPHPRAQRRPLSARTAA